MADQKYGNAGILGNRQIDYNVSVIQQFIKVRVIGALSLGTSVAAVIKAVGADSGLVEQPGKIVVPALVFTQSVDNAGLFKYNFVLSYDGIISPICNALLLII